MRVGIVAYLHESNTFIPDRTRLEHFHRDVLAHGPAVRERFEGAEHEVGGFFEALGDGGVEPVPLFAARAMPYGPIDAETHRHIIGLMLRSIREAGPLDGVLAAPHGATVSVGEPDADGHWLSLLRRELGTGTPIVATMDPHGNLSPRMVSAVDALVAYRTNPHVDQRRCGREAGELMVRTLRGEIRPTLAASYPPLSINIECQSTSAEPCAPIYTAADATLTRRGVLSNSIVLGFPYADVAEMGSACLFVTDNDPDLAQRCADELGRLIWDARRSFRPHLIGVGEALDRAEKLDGTVALLDMGDNIGGGAPGDGVALVRAILARGAGPAFACIHDPRAVERCSGAGPGRTLQLRIGGRSDQAYGPPLDIDATVLSLHEGCFAEPGVSHGGFTRFDQGPTAIVRTGSGLTLMLNTHRTAPFSLAQITAFGLDPSAFRLIVAKGVHAPVASYAAACRHFIRVNTPGFTAADTACFEYHHRRRPMFPFEPEAAWPPTTPKPEV